MNNPKRALALVLCLVMLLTVFPMSVFAAEPLPFKDVQVGTWFYDDVAYAYEHDLMRGVGNDLFAPAASTSRAMIVTILHRIEGAPASSKNLTYTDVKSGTWYIDAVKWATEKKIVNGYSEKKFGPSDDITREQLATILYRYAEYKQYDLTKSADLSVFQDANKVSSWAKTAMSWANATGLIRGTYVGLEPTGKATRAQTAAILHRFMENIPPVGPVALTVTFDLNYDGSPEATNVEVNAGDQVAKPEDPVRSGFVFTGWYLSQTDENPFSFDTAVTENLLLYARWTEESAPTDDNYYDVVFMPNNGTDGVVDMQRVHSGDKAEKPQDPAWAGYAFTGWYVDAELTMPYDFNAPVRQDLFLYAGWGNPNGGEGFYSTSEGGGTDYSITGIQAADGGFSVTVNANDTAILIVEVLDEESGELITTGAAETPDYCELEQVFVPVSDLPAHFDIRATLVDENGEQLCDPYTTVRFTSAFEIYDAKTVNDFEGETVINFDDAPDENFGVLADGVKIISTENEKNKIEAVENEILDEDGLVCDYEMTGYRITNPDESIGELQSGDIIYIVDTTGIPLLFKIATIEQEDDGSFFVTQDVHGELTDYYTFIKVDMTFGGEESAEPEPPAEDAAPLAEIINVDDVGGGVEFAMNFDYTHPTKRWFQVHASGSISIEVSITILYDAHLFREDYIECSVSKTTTVDGSFTIEFTNDYDTGSGDDTQSHNLLKEYPLVPKKIIPTPIAGLSVNVKVTIPLNLTISGKVTVEYKSEQVDGFTYNTDAGRQKIDRKSRTVDLYAEGKAELSLSVKAKLTIGFGGELVEIGVTGEAGVKVTATAVLNLAESTSAEKRHACRLCVDIKVEWFVEVHGSLEAHLVEGVLDWEIFSVKLFAHTGPIKFPGSPEGKCFVSLINDEDSLYHGHIKFGIGECENFSYRLDVKLHNAQGQDVDGKVTIKKPDGTVVAEGAAPLKTHLYNGMYTVTGRIEGTDVTRSVSISNDAKEVILTPSSADASIEGTVKDAETGGPIEGATVIISEGGRELKCCTTDASGKFSAPVPAGSYKITISMDNYVTFITNETVADGQTRTIETSLMVNKSFAQRRGGFSGTIRDAVTNDPISGVSLALREGWNAPASEHVLHRLTTDDNGFFEYKTGNVFGVITGLEPGNYTLTATKEGYASISFNIVVIPGTVKGDQNATMTKGVAGDNYRVVLTWTGEPSDLDSHYRATLASGSADHVYYHHKVGSSANLDRDDTDYSGPETVTVTDFSSLQNGFTYSVHDFSNRSSSSSTVLSNSGAKVVVYQGDAVLATFFVPTDRVGTVWNVFSIDAAGNITSIGSFENISSPENVGITP